MVSGQSEVMPCHAYAGKDDGFFDQRKMYGGWNYPGQQQYATVAMNSQFENNRIKYDGINQPDCQRHYLMCGASDPVTSAAADMMKTANHQQHQQQHHHAPVSATQSASAYGNAIFDPLTDNQVCD